MILTHFKSVIKRMGGGVYDFFPRKGGGFVYIHVKFLDKD